MRTLLFFKLQTTKKTITNDISLGDPDLLTPVVNWPCGNPTIS